ncbi:MAG: helix-turn-helix domain-containing protein [Thermodesulfovibrionales bacterium]
MAGRDIIMVRQKELKWLHVIHKVFEGALTQGQAAEILSLSERQVRRIVRRIRDEGDGGIQHQSRGRASNRRIPKKTVDRIIGLYRQKYKGFGPTLTSEKLYELEDIQLSKETVRTYLIVAGKGAEIEWHKHNRRSQQVPKTLSAYIQQEICKEGTKRSRSPQGYSRRDEP